jgi:hypothetical protein
MELAQTDPLQHATEAGFVEVRGTRYYAITDPRSHYFANPLKADGGAWSPEHSAYIFPLSCKPEFDAACDRIAAMPWRPLDEGLARYCSEELYQLGIRSMQQPVFADNPTGPKKKVYVAPSEELFEKATELVFKQSRITPDQVAKINTYIATGEATPTILERTPQEFAAGVEDRTLTQSDAKRILRSLEPAPKEALDELTKMVRDGRVTERMLGFDPVAEPEKMAGLKAQQAYDFINDGRRMADNDLKKKVVAYQSLGALGERDINLEELTAASARSLIATGAVFVNTDEFTRALDSVNRDGFDLAGQRGAYGQRLSSAGTDQGAFETSLERMNTLIRDGAIEGLNRSATAVELPTHGYVAGGVAWASSQHALLVIDEDHYLPLTRSQIALEKGLDLRDHEGAFVAFQCRRNDKPFGMLTDANSVGQAICEADARQTLDNNRRTYTTADAPAGPVQGKVVALRGDFASLDLGDAGILTVPKGQLSDPAPRYNATVTYEPEDLALAAAAPSQTRAPRKR